MQGKRSESVVLRLKVSYNLSGGEVDEANVVGIPAHGSLLGGRELNLSASVEGLVLSLHPPGAAEQVLAHRVVRHPIADENEAYAPLNCDFVSRKRTFFTFGFLLSLLFGAAVRTLLHPQCKILPNTLLSKATVEQQEEIDGKILGKFVMIFFA